MKAYMDGMDGPPDHFLPHTYVESHHDGPLLLKYKVLIEQNNTPFRIHNSVTKPMKRLWNYLVRQQAVQEIFIRYIFGKSKDTVRQYTDTTDNAEEDSIDLRLEPIRIVHKEQENISTFCINNRKPFVMSLATPKEIHELNIKALLTPSPWLEHEVDYDIHNMTTYVLIHSDFSNIFHDAYSLP